MNNFYGALAYNDEVLYAVVYNVFEKQQYVVACIEVYKGDIKELKGLEQIGNIAQALNEKMGELEEQLGGRIHKLDLIIEPEKFYYESKTFEMEFDELHTITNDDIDKILNKVVRYDTAKVDYTIANFTPTLYTVDGMEKNNPLGCNGRVVLVTGDLVYADSNTVYAIERIIDDSRYRKNDLLVSSHLLKYSTGFNNGEAIIEFGRMKIKFLTKNDDLTQNFNLDFGIGHIYQKVYLELSEQISAENSEKVVRYLQNNFKLSEIKFDFEIVEGINYSYAVEMFKKIASEYIQGVILQVYKEGIDFKKIYSITNDYPNAEWVNYLKTFIDMDIEEYKVMSVTGNFGRELKIFNAISVANEMRLKG